MVRIVWMTIAHISASMNIEADFQSRSFNDRTERKLHKNIFQRLSQEGFSHEIDLLASRLNCQMKSFISCHSDPESFAVDAFTENWCLWMIFVFQSFSLIQRVLSKVERDQATGQLIVPHWPTAVWYPQMLRLLIQEPVMFPCGKRVPTLEHTSAIYPLHFWL